jgi:class 3 adenylate cyclase/YHS domain-containing protein
MTAAAVAHDAMIDKLIGDAIMLVYGVPAARGDEVARALATARDMHRAFDGLLARWRPTLPPTLRLGLAVGVASGDVVLANVGSAARMDYTVVGSAVNLAARLTGAARSGETLVDRATREAAPDAFHFRAPRALLLKGFRGRVGAYSTRFDRRAAARWRGGGAVVDPVCGMKLRRVDALRAVFRGRTYFFCTPRCRAVFRSDPTRQHRGRKRAARAR